MKLIMKAALGALAAATLAVGAAQPANARVVVSVGVGPWGYAGHCSALYYNPVYYGGVWYRGPFCYRWHHGIRTFWINGGWRFHAWHGPRPAHFHWGHHGFATWRGHGNWGHGHWRGHAVHHGHVMHHGNMGHNGHVGHAGHVHNGGHVHHGGHHH